MSKIFTDFFVNLPKDYYLTAILIITPPYRLVYKSGDTFDPTGMVIEAIYNNNLREVIDDYTISPTTPLTDDDTFVTISYTNEDITVTKNIPIQVTPILTGIEITKMPTKTNYFFNEQFDPAGMEVTASYSDGHTAVVTNYLVAPNTFATLGSIGLVVTYAEDGIAKMAEVPVIVEPAIVLTPQQSGTLTYNGSVQTPTWVGVNPDGTAAWIGEAPDTLTISGDINGVEAGSYTATFTPKYGYSWEDGKTTAKNVNWQINRAKISSVPAQSGTLTYTGSSLTPTWNNYNASQLTIGGTTSAVNAGSYTVQFTPTANYMWNDSTTAAKSVNWTIGKASLELPTQKGSLTYTGNSLSPTLSNESKNYCTVGGTQSAINAGNYTMTLTPLDNFQWADGTTTTKSIDWTIGKATPTLTLSKTSISLDSSTTSTTITVTTNSTGTLSVKSSDTSIVSATISNKIITVTGLASGSATITVTLAADNNFNSQTISANISVNISKIPVGYTELEYISNPKYNYLTLASLSKGKDVYISKVVMDIIPPIKFKFSGYGYIFGAYYYKDLSSTYGGALFRYSLKFTGTDFVLEYAYKTKSISNNQGSISIPYNNIDTTSGHLIINIDLPSQETFSLQINNIKETASGINWANNMLIASNVGASGFYTCLNKTSSLAPDGYMSGFSVCYIKYYGQNGVLYDEYIPVLTSTNKVGLYDTIAKKFITGNYTSSNLLEAGPVV